jgi:uncharacterized protein YjbI with pentapeptide repeats
MRGAKLVKTVFEECSFERCVLNEATLSHCRFLKCKFIACDLSVVKVPNSRFTDCEFIDCKLVGVEWTAVGSEKTVRMMFSVAFDGCVLDYSDFFDLPVKRMSRCSAKEVDLTKADLTGADCRETDFSGAKFDRTNLIGANFVGARAYAINPLACKVKKARFSFPEATALLAAFEVDIEW